MTMQTATAHTHVYRDGSVRTFTALAAPPPARITRPYHYGASRPAIRPNVPEGE